MAPVKSSKKAAKTGKKIVLDASNANADSKIFDVEAFAKYLKEHIKVDGRTGQLSDKVTVTASGNKITIVTFAPFSGKYAKYLTKRFLKKNELRDWLRVVASSRNVYEVRFFNIAGDDAEEEDDEEEDDE